MARKSLENESVSPAPAARGPVRVGIVGAGFAARFHYEGYRRVFGVPVEVVGVTSQTPARRTAFASERGLQVFDSIADLIDAVEVVDVCTPGYTHADVAVQALTRGRHTIVEKPFTGYYGTDKPSFRGNRFPKRAMLQAALGSSEAILAAARRGRAKVLYAENWVYAPAIQKEREILVKSRGQILWMIGEESHSGSHAPSYGIWAKSGGGSLVGKSCHPLTAALYLKQEEGLATLGRPIRPASVSARTHEITRNPRYRDEKFLRTDYFDIEDYAQMHITFNDGMVADIFATELVHGGVHNWLEVHANNHRTHCSLNPVNALTTYNPREELLRDVYVVEKTGTKQGWSHPAPDEDWMHGYPQEIQDFMEAVYFDRVPLCGGLLARDCVAVMYSAYLSAERKGAEVKVPSKVNTGASARPASAS